MCDNVGVMRRCAWDGNECWGEVVVVSQITPFTGSPIPIHACQGHTSYPEGDYKAPTCQSKEERV